MRSLNLILLVTTAYSLVGCVSKELNSDFCHIAGITRGKAFRSTAIDSGALTEFENLTSPKCPRIVYYVAFNDSDAFTNRFRQRVIDVQSRNPGTVNAQIEFEGSISDVYRSNHPTVIISRVLYFRLV